MAKKKPKQQSKPKKKKRKERTDTYWRNNLGQEYVDELNELVDDLFERAFRKKWTWAEFAENAGIAYGTLARLGDKKTRLPQFRTLYLMAAALGGKLVYKPGERVTLKITWTREAMTGRRLKPIEKVAQTAA